MSNPDIGQRGCWAPRGRVFTTCLAMHWRAPLSRPRCSPRDAGRDQADLAILPAQISPAVRHWPVLHCLNLKCLNLAPKLLRTIQILHDANMANTKQCVSMLQMTTILKRCADELDQTSVPGTSALARRCSAIDGDSFVALAKEHWLRLITVGNLQKRYHSMERALFFPSVAPEHGTNGVFVFQL